MAIFNLESTLVIRDHASKCIVGEVKFNTTLGAYEFIPNKDSVKYPGRAGFGAGELEEILTHVRVANKRGI